MPRPSETCPFCRTRPVLAGSATCGGAACIRAAVWTGRARNALSVRARIRAEANALTETQIARAHARADRLKAS